MSGTKPARACVPEHRVGGVSHVIGQRPARDWHRAPRGQEVGCYGLATPRNRIQETAISVQFAPGMRFLVSDFGVDAKAGTD
eukprot:2003312-Rhodomonas_salina.2